MDLVKNANTKYKVGEKVVYPMQGVGAVDEIVVKDFKGNDTLYYVIYLSSNDMTVMIPTDKVDGLGIRPIVSKSIAQNAIKNLEKPTEPAISDWKLRYQNNMDLLKDGGINQIATVVGSLYFRSKQKELPILERKLFDNAKKMLIDELSLALKEDLDDTEEKVYSKLELSSISTIAKQEA